MVRMLAITLGVLALGVTLAAADVTGDWTLGLRPDFSGVDEDIRCTFKQDGAMLTADCGGAAMAGSVDGQAVSLPAPWIKRARPSPASGTSKAPR
jgi:hypothetical protein